MTLLSNIISGVFIFEACVKIITLGFVFGKNTYLKDGFNILDFVIVVFTIISWILESLSNVNI